MEKKAPFIAVKFIWRRVLVVIGSYRGLPLKYMKYLAVAPKLCILFCMAVSYRIQFEIRVPWWDRSML